MEIYIMSNNTSTSTFLLNDFPISESAPVPDDYHFDVLSEDHTVVGVRPAVSDDFDLEVYEDLTYSTLIESSNSVGDMVDFVALDKNNWASPPSRGVRVTKGTTSYVIEMENDVDDHLITDSWSGSMDYTPGNPVLDIGPPGSWEDRYVTHPSVLYIGGIYHMWYSGKDSANHYRIGYATSPDGITWTKYSGNPVLDLGPPGSWEENMVTHPEVLYDGTIYHMWYSGYDSSDIYRIGYATSMDGISWTKNPANPVIGLGSSVSWEGRHVFSCTVFSDGTKFHMWYTGKDSAHHYRIGYAISTDGVTWTKYLGNPVLDIGSSGSWDDNHVSAPMVIYYGNTYHMWYSGYYSVYDGIDYKIGYAYSSDGISWTKYASNPVMDAGSPGSWDDAGVLSPMVIFDGEIFHMWYRGWNGVNCRIGYARSLGVNTWMKVPDSPVLDLGPPGSWEDIYVTHPSVIYDGSMYHMWYSGKHSDNYRIGYAVSPDGISWTKSIANPVLDLGPQGSWDDKYVEHPTVLHDGKIYHMWYSGKHGSTRRIGYATSLDGITWDKSLANPVIDIGPPGSWDEYGAHTPTVIFDGHIYHMWYGGQSGQGGKNRRIGYATSYDGITWSKSATNPVLDIGPSSTWDDSWVFFPHVIYDGTIFHMWYGGYDGSNSRIGYAKSSDGITWTKNLGNPLIDVGPTGSWEDVGVHSPTVIYDGITYHMWYRGYDGTNCRIGHAILAGGISWRKLKSNVEVLDAYEIIDIIAGCTYTINLEVPPTADLDLFIFDTTGGRDDAVSSSTSAGLGIDESISFTASSTGEYLLVITNENGGTGTYSVISNAPPTADAGPDQTVFEGDTILLDGSASFDPDGIIETYEWDYESDGIYDYQETSGTAPDGTFDGKTTYVYGDNGIYMVTLRVTDGSGAIDTDTCNVTVNNIAPTINSITAPSGNEGSQISFTSIATDPGSDDLTFTWDWGDGTPSNVTTYYNDGFNPDPYPSPEGIYPFTVTDSVHHTYGDNGVYTIVLTVDDDDFGVTTINTTVLD
jgi:predicted GH43/DUF377 family glycosyl hydrolase